MTRFDSSPSRWLLLVMLLAAPACAQVPMTVSLVDGETITGRVQGLDDEGKVSITVGEEIRQVPRKQVVAIESQAARVRPAAESVRLELASGDVVHGVIDGGNYDEVTLTTSAVGTFKVFLDQIQRIVYLDNLGEEAMLPTQRGEDDELCLSLGDRLDRIPGEVIRVTRTGVVFSFANGEEKLFSFVKNRVVAVRLGLAGAAPAKKRDTNCIARFRDGTRLSGVLRELEDGTWRLDVGGGAVLSINRQAIKSLHFRSQAFRYLSDLEPAGFEETPFLAGGPLFGLLRDRGFHGDGPLVIGSQRFRKGIGLHAKARVSYDLSAVLGGDVKTFRAKVGVDPATRDRRIPGSVRLVILVDGAEKWSSPVLGAGSEPVACEIGGLADARTLVIEARFARSLQTGARAVLGDAILLR